MANFGLKVTNNNNALLLNSEAVNSVFLGKAVYDRVINNSNPYMPTYSYTTVYKTPKSAKRPLIFLGHVVGTSLRGFRLISAVQMGDLTWEITIATSNTNDGGTDFSMYCFGDATQSGFTTSGSYGLQLFNSSGSKTYDSRWDRKILNPVDYQVVNVSLNGSQSPIAAGISKPCFMVWSPTVGFVYQAQSGITRVYYYYPLFGVNENGDFTYSYVVYAYQDQVAYDSNYHNKSFPTNYSATAVFIDGVDYD